MTPEKTIVLPEGKYLTFKKALAESRWFFEDDRSLFALALGGNRSATFDAIAKNPGIEIIWRGSFLPIWARPFGLISAAYGGIVKIVGRAALEIACDNLLPQTAMELLVVSRDREEAIASKLRRLGREARALELAAEESDGVVAAIFIDDDQDDRYPIIYRHIDSVVLPFFRDYEKTAESGSRR